MDLTILAIVFFGSNLLGMYNYVPFTNINPMSNFIQRGIGSLQLTSTVYAFQELGEAAFPNVQKEREQEAIKHALDEYMSARSNATFILPTRSDTTTTPTVTTTTFVDKHGTIRSQAVTKTIREYLHPNLDTHMGIINAVWEALVFALMGLTILLIIWKELVKSLELMKCHEMSPGNVTEKSSLSMIVEQLLKDRLSVSNNSGHQNVSSSAATPASNNNELQGLLNQLTIGFSARLESLDSRLRDAFQSSGRVTASGFESIAQQLEDVRKQQSEAFSQDTIPLLLKSLEEFIDVQKSVPKNICECSLTSQPNVQAQTSNAQPHNNKFEEDKFNYDKLEFEIDLLRNSFKDLKTKLESCNDEAMKRRLQALEDLMHSLESATSDTPIISDNITKGIEGLREKQEDLENRVDEVKRSDPTAELAASEKNWGQSFQRLDDRMSRLEMFLSDIQENIQKHNLENNAVNSGHVISIHDLQSRLKATEESYFKKISEIESRIYNPGGKFSNNTKTNEMSLEELIRLFKNYHQHEQAEMEWMKSRVASVADNSDRVSRIENIIRDNSRDVGKCMNKLGIKFELSGEDKSIDQPDSVSTPASNVVVKQEVDEPKEKRGDAKGPTVSISERNEQGNDSRIHNPKESKQRTNQSLNSWATFSKNTQEQEKQEADKRQAEQDELRAQGKLIMPQVNLKETYIKGIPKDNEDYSQSEKTEHKIRESSPSVSGLKQSMWASSTPAAPISATIDAKTSSLNQPNKASPISSSVSASASKDAGVPGINQSRWASPGPESALTPDSKDSSTPDTKPSGMHQSKWAFSTSEPFSTPTSKNSSISKSKSWAETPPFTPAGNKKETPITAEKSPKIPTDPKSSTVWSGRRRKSSSGLRGSIHAQPSNSADKMDMSEDSIKPASPVENNDKEKTKEKSLDLSGIKQSRWADE